MIANARPSLPATATTPAAADVREPPRAGWFRWIVCGLLFLAVTISYVDRQVIGVLKTTLMQTYDWSDSDFANIIFTFQLAYALGQLVSGRLFDRIGVRLGFTIAVTLWSVAAMAHGLVGLVPGDAAWSVPIGPGTNKILHVGLISVLGFCLARFALGLPEGGTFPGAVKAVGEWFPRRERALAIGLFNAGTNVGAMLTPLIVPVLISSWGWPAAFYATGAIGFVWLLCWWGLYDAPERHAWVSPAELAYIRSDPPDPPVRIAWWALLRYRQTWAFAIGMALSAPVWWFYLYWIPGFLQEQHGLNVLQLGAPLVTIYLMTDVGSIGGGWLSSHLLQRGWSVNAARKTAMLCCALCVTPVFLAGITPSLWTATLLVGLAASAHQGFSANLFTIVSDTMPRKAISSVVGIGGMAGAFAGMGVAKCIGYILDTGWPGRYAILFAFASTAYLLNLLVIHLLLPRLEGARFEDAA